jgi:signal transduction histidine kinase
VWDEPPAPEVPALSWRDRSIVAVAVVLAVVEGSVRHGISHRLWWVAVAVVIMPALAWRRNRPVAMIGLAFGGSAGVTLVLGQGSPLSAMGLLLLLPYALYRWGSGRQIVIGTVVVAVCAGIAMPAAGLRAGDAAAGTIVLFAIVVSGLAIRFRARSKARELEQIASIERERLARDLHDTVAHHVSAMAIRAQAGLATAGTSPTAAVEALRVIEGEAARTLAEMRAIVHALRRDRTGDDGGDRFPTPGIADLARLAGPAGTGPAVEVVVGGDVTGLSDAVGTAIYRLAQEAVTNAIRHARNATRVEVRVDADAAAVRLRVRDDGEGGRASTAGPPGYGLIGMAERAGLLGGSCEAGPGPGRGWTVTAALPRDGAGR